MAAERTSRRLASGLEVATLAAGEGPTVICLHGFPDSAIGMAGLVEGLAAAGYRGVAPWLPGYAPTGLPADGDLSLAALARFVLAFADDIGASTFALVGHDWGSAIAQATAAAAPDRVAAVVGMAVPDLHSFAVRSLAHPRQLWRSRYMAAFQLAGAAEWLAGDDFAPVRRLWARWSPGWIPDAAFVDGALTALAAPANREAALAYYRALLPRPGAGARWQASRRLAFAEPATPTTLICGLRDGCIGPEIFPPSRDARPVIDLPAGHFMHLELPSEVLAHVIIALRRAEFGTAAGA